MKQLETQFSYIEGKFQKQNIGHTIEKWMHCNKEAHFVRIMAIRLRSEQRFHSFKFYPLDYWDEQGRGQ